MTYGEREQAAALEATLNKIAEELAEINKTLKELIPVKDVKYEPVKEEYRNTWDLLGK